MKHNFVLEIHILQLSHLIGLGPTLYHYRVSWCYKTLTRLFTLSDVDYTVNNCGFLFDLAMSEVLRG